ncbi:MAG: DUF2786 domain-containing protein [Trueperaceae bacterium]|nr:DUF2786 domain-containing protein [Trueperaceae bacterium]
MPKDKIVSTIRALLARASKEQNSNEHERNAALRHAHRLMEEHAISMLEVSQDEMGSIDREQMNIGISNWKRSVVGLIASLYGCAVCWPTNEKSKNFGDVFIYGRDNNRATVQVISEFVIESIEKEWEGYKSRSTRNDLDENSFCIGALYGVRDTVISLRKARADFAYEGSTALAVLDQYESWGLEAKEAMNVNQFAAPPTEVKDLREAMFGRSVGKKLRLEPHLEASTSKADEV